VDQVAPLEHQADRAGALDPAVAEHRCTARGALVDEPPTERSPLPAHRGTILTPHTGVLTNVAYRTLRVTTVENVVRILRDEPPDPASIAILDR
jgi:phosphoglycerate dehydrogenase-like enzyme